MGFRKITRKPVGAGSPRPPPIYGPMPAVPISRWIC